MDKAAQNRLIRSFERHLRAENRSERTIATYLIDLCQDDAFLHAHGTILAAATRPTRCGAGSGRSCRTSRSSACPGGHRLGDP